MSTKKIHTELVEMNLSLFLTGLTRLPFLMCRLITAFFASCLLFSSLVMAESKNVVEEVAFSRLAQDKTQISIRLRVPVEEPQSFSTKLPARIALDFPDTESVLATKTFLVGVNDVETVKTVTAGNRTRVVINMKRQLPYKIEVKGNYVYVTIDQPKLPGPLASGGLVGESYAKKLSTTGFKLEKIDFARGPGGEGKLIVDLDKAGAQVELTEKGGNVELLFGNTLLPEDMHYRLNVLDFATPVKEIVSSSERGGAKLVMIPRTDFDYISYQSKERFVLEIAPLDAQEKERRDKENSPFTGERLSLNFQNIEVRSILQLLADFTDFNLVTSDSVNGSLTLRLKSVPWDQALQIILDAKGLDKRVNGNVMYVAPIEEISAREQAKLESKNKTEELEALVSEVIPISYAKAAELSTLLKSSENRLMSERGNVTVDERTNSLLVQDTRARLGEIYELIRKLDIPVRQVLVEARIIIANDDFSRELGSRFKVAAGNKSSLPTFGNGVINTAVSSASPIETAGGFGINLPTTTATNSNFFLNVIGKKFNVGLELSAMQSDGKGKILSSPKLLTLNQQEASIKQGVEIPFQESTSSGATNVEFKEAVLELTVTPQITPDDRIAMEIIVRKDNPDFSRSILGVPPIDTRRISTSVLLRNGDTVVLGGVFEQIESESTDKVPLLGDIPVLGHLFKLDTKKNEKRELLIFITPKIVQESMSLQ